MTAWFTFVPCNPRGGAEVTGTTFPPRISHAMTITTPQSALAPFYRHTVSITGKRRENAVARDLAATLSDACIMGGELAVTLDGAPSPTNERLYTVTILRTSWLDHFPPQIGDAVTPADDATYPRMLIQHVLPFASGWRCTCRSIEPKPRAL